MSAEIGLIEALNKRKYDRAQRRKPMAQRVREFHQALAREQAAAAPSSSDGESGRTDDSSPSKAGARKKPAK